jgi:hypothetical protein
MTVAISPSTRDREYHKFVNLQTSESGAGVFIVPHSVVDDRHWTYSSISGTNRTTALMSTGTGSLTEVYGFYVHAKPESYGGITVWASGGGGSVWFTELFNNSSTGINYSMNSVIPWKLGAGSMAYIVSTTGSLSIVAIGRENKV